MGAAAAEGWSKRTVQNRQHLMEHFTWWMVNVAEVQPSLRSLDRTIFRLFLGYIREPAPNGRWGSAHHSSKKASLPSTIKTYHANLRAFQNFCVAEGILHGRPMENVKAPKVRDEDQIEPFKADQVQKLLDATRRMPAPERNLSIILTLIDTGVRASELCGIKIADIDRGSGKLKVIGKGDKERDVYMGVGCRRALWRYLEAERRDALPVEQVFVSVGGHRSGEGMTRSGVGQILKQAGEIVGITGVRCSPHTCRHTFSIEFLRGGGDVFELQKLLGHEDLTMVRRYVKKAQEDLESAHRRASPVDRLKLR